MEFKQITDRDIAHDIFVQASLTGEFNSKNYTEDQFDRCWDKWWMAFYVLYDGDTPLAFSGIRDFGDYARILDRFFVFPHARKPGLGDGKYCQYITPLLMEETEGKIPFFSMEFASRRNVILNAVNVCNKVLPDGKKFHLLDGLYETAPDSWQNIAIQKPHTTIDLNYKEIK